MKELIAVIMGLGVLAMVLVLWLWMYLRPASWLPPGSNPPSPYKNKPKPPANPPAAHGCCCNHKDAP